MAHQKAEDCQSSIQPAYGQRGIGIAIYFAPVVAMLPQFMPLEHHTTEATLMHLVERSPNLGTERIVEIQILVGPYKFAVGEVDSKVFEIREYRLDGQFFADPGSGKTVNRMTQTALLGLSVPGCGRIGKEFLIYVEDGAREFDMSDELQVL